MKKKIVALILLLAIITGNTIAFAAEGDIIHTGLKKIYRLGNSADMDELVDDILAGADPKKFYREVAYGKYVNIVEEENKQLERLGEIFNREGITNPEDMEEYVADNSDYVDEQLQEAIQGLEAKEWSIEDYKGASNALILVDKHYSTPEPGSREGTTRIATLNLPSGGNKWIIEILEEPVEPMAKDTVLNKGTSYTKGSDVEIEVGEYLILYAVDRNNRIKGYVNIEITENMVKKPREEATKIKIGTVEKGNKQAGAIVIKDLEDKVPEGASKWQVMVRDTSTDKVYKDEIIEEAIDYTVGEDIIVATENELHPVSDGFKKFILLLATDKEGQIKGYNVLEISKDKVSLPPIRLEKGVHFEGPVVGDKDETTKFTNLDLSGIDEAVNWEAVVSKNRINVPVVDSNIEAIPNPDKLTVPLSEIKVDVGDFLLLAATDDDGKIKGYRIFELDESQVKGKTADALPEGSYSPPVKGSTTGTTKVETLNLDGVNGATKWMYKVGENLLNPILDKVVEGSMDYTAGDDVKANVGDTLLILATDNEGRVKAFGRIELDGDMIKDPLATELIETTHYTKPVKGDGVGSTKIGFLQFYKATSWKYTMNEDEIDIPEMNSEVLEAEDITMEGNSTEDIKIFDETSSELKADEGFKRNMIIYAIKDNKVIAYKKFELDNSNVKLPEAEKLTLQNYDKPIKGNNPNSTRITKLEHIGLADTEKFMYKFIDEDMILEFNEVVLGAKELRVDRDLYPTTRSNYLLIIAVDNRNRTKYYTSIPLDEKNVRADNAPQLREKTHYTNPIPGEGKNSTKFGFLNLPEDASKWMYKIGKESFGVIEAGITVDGTSYKIDQDILPVESNDHLLLLAVDDQDRVIAYREFRLIGDNIRGGDAKKLTKDNYILGKGNKPSTTSFSNLVPLGLDNPNSIRWKIKLVNSTEDIPYMNSIIEGAEFYNVGGDITVTKDTDGEYGYILLLATDSGSRTKGYIYIKIDGDDVKEHAPVLGEIGIEEGDAIDTTKVVGLDDEKSYKYLIGDKAFDIPAAGDPLPRNVGNMPDDNNISIRIGEHLTIFEIDSEDRIVGYKSFEITSDNIKQGSAEFTDMEILEGNVVNGGIAIKITLTNANWANVKNDKSIRDRFFNGFRADSQYSQWTKVVNSLIADGKGAIDANENILTVRLPQTLEYDIADEQKISLIIPSEAIKDAINPIVATGTIAIKPTVGATISGTVIDNIIRESDIKAGGATIVVDLEDGIWVTDVSDIINGFISDGPQWNLIKEKIGAQDIVRNSSSKVTITLPAVDVDFDIDKETITLTIPAKLIEGAKEDVVASPTFTLYPNILQVEGEALDSKDIVTMEAPDNRALRKNMDTWIIEVNIGNLKDEITDKDIIVAGLPRGLKTTVEKVKDQENQIAIKVSGTASSSIDSTQEISVRIKGSAVTEPNSMDSNNIRLYIKPGIAKVLDNVGYELDYEGDELILYITNVDENMEYSLDSTNGINGAWKDIILDENETSFKIGKAEPMRIFVREKAQPKVFEEVAILEYGEAPGDVSIDKVEYNDDGSKCTVTLKGLEQTKKYQYSVDDSKEWKDLDLDGEISLGENSDLRVRIKATEGLKGELNSLPTNKLNGIFLGNVKLNAGQGKIENTHTTIEYSLNSTNGSDGSWTAGRNNETLVSFNKDNRVWIRERRNPINKRELGTIGQEDTPDISSISYNIKDSKISNTNSQLEYRIANGNWIDINSNEVEGVEFKPGKLEFRAKGTRDKLASQPITKAEIPQPTDGPRLKTDDYHKKIFYLKEENWYEIDDNNDRHEYKIGSTGEWRPGRDFNKDENKNQNIIVYVRETATDEKLPSKETPVNFTKNIELKNISINVEEKSIIGTTVNMEYSINSTDGINGAWETCSNSKTTVDFVQGMDIWIREKNKPLNKLQIAQNIPKEPQPDLTHVYYNIATNKIANYTNNDLEYRIAGDKWHTIDRKSNAYEIQFIPGKFEFRKKATKNSLASDPKEKVVIKAKASKPVIQWDDVENKIIKINEKSDSWSIFEYRINDSHWITGELLRGEDLSDDKTVEIRIKATPTELPSQITKIEFTPNMPLEHIILSTHVHPLELNGTTTQMEYAVRYNRTDTDQMWYKRTLDDSTRTMWLNCDDKNTKLPDVITNDNVVKIIIRDKNQPENEYEVPIE